MAVLVLIERSATERTDSTRCGVHTAASATVASASLRSTVVIPAPCASGVAAGSLDSAAASTSPDVTNPNGIGATASGTVPNRIIIGRHYLSHFTQDDDREPSPTLTTNFNCATGSGTASATHQ